ncbi:methionyl-tRNA formyltransferase [Candidatus Saganbacteria bacterium]|nr:methionyl-tRNA formyltransferase [Candidatus Saganbacteria bacterium]
MKVLLFGVSEFATELLLKFLNSPYQVCGLVFNRSNNFDIQDMKGLAHSRQIPFWEVESLADSAELAPIKQLEPDVILVATFDQKLPRAFYSLAKIAALNLHPSLLPYYRGYHPYFWPIANGEKKTGLTFHFLTDSFDAGDVIAQVEVPILAEDTAGTVIHKQKLAAWPLLEPLLKQMAATGESPQGRPQPAGEYPKSPKMKPEDLFIRWPGPTQKIIDLVRALNPHSPAYTIFRGELLGVYQVAAWPDNSHDAPGAIIKITAEGPVVKTADGALLLKVVLAGKRYLLSGADFVRRENAKTGERFS